MKFDYEVDIKTSNSNIDICKEIITSYGNTSDILYKIYNNKIIISFSMSTLKTIKDFTESYLYKNLILKANIAYCLVCNRGLKIKKLTIIIDDEKEEVDLSKNNFITSIIEDREIEKIKLTDEELKRILNIKESDYHNKKEYCALYAYLASFSTDNIYEKFGYLWTAMNAFYTEKYSYINKGKKARECEYQLEMLKSNKWFEPNKKYEQKEMKKLYEMMTVEISNILEKDYKKFYKKVIDKELANYYILAKTSKEYGIDPIALLTIGLPYHFRCNYFHGSRTVFVFYNKKSKDYKVMSLLSYFVKKYLQDNIYTLFREEGNSNNK